MSFMQAHMARTRRLDLETVSAEGFEAAMEIMAHEAIGQDFFFVGALVADRDYLPVMMRRAGYCARLAG